MSPSCLGRRRGLGEVVAPGILAVELVVDDIVRHSEHVCEPGRGALLVDRLALSDLVRTVYSVAQACANREEDVGFLVLHVLPKNPPLVMGDPRRAVVVYAAIRVGDACFCLDKGLEVQRCGSRGTSPGFG